MNKTAIITGASRGIGKAIALRFAKAGYNLSICCQQNKAMLEEFSTQLREKFGVEVLTFVGNVGEYSFASEMIEETCTRYGHIDVLVNNAGIAHIGLFSDMTIEEWNKIVSTNLTSVFCFSNIAAKHMISAKRGKIIQISSVWGEVGASCEVAYSACKGAVNALTKALAKELAPSNIQVNAISCGVIDTDMNNCFSDDEKRSLADEIPAGRFGTPDEVADLVFDIAYGHNYLTGQIIRLDGGWI